MDLQELIKLLKTQLAHLLVSIPDAKDLVLDSDLTKPLDRVVGIAFLKEHGVDKIFKLEPGQKSLPGCGKRIYLVRPRLVTMKYIADHINTEIAKGERRSYKIVMVPRKLHVCEMILENEGVMGHVTIDEFPLELFPLDSDLLSLELPEFFSSFYLDEDMTWLHTVSSALVNLQRLFGRAPNIYSIGKGAKMVHELMETMFENHKERRDKTYHIGQIFIVDRDVDYVSLLCTPMTYEAMLDESFGINCGMIDFDSEVTGESKGTKMLLTSSDEIYAQIRDCHFSQMFSYMKMKAKELQELENKKNNLQSVGDMKQFVANDLRVLKQQQKLLSTHISACEAIIKMKGKHDFEESIRTEHNLLECAEFKENMIFIEECIQKQVSPILTLRLLCLASLTQEGLSQREYKSIKTQFLHSHGFEHLVTMFRLKKLGLLTEQDTSQTSMRPVTSKPSALYTRKFNYRALSRKLGLVPDAEAINLQRPNHLSYVFSGAYTPLPCKLIEQILIRETLVGLEDVGRMCGGLHADLKAKHQAISAGTTIPAMKVILVFFLGGCTFSEITALRLIARLHGVRIIVATTAITTANRFIDGLIEKVNR
ncbi:vacuolar protein sorting-associated protein 33b [Plakobranchus ocellatus]|uniref:Vacuolar protein sorting-associated protein 33b n=1 Tax=Plakobranchus ocellatus TaxID=259542 RepID=A0AAV3Z5Z5_9GAST|nr:vacuolar protein sorting-associated protein 33b [Plakobranchus ocellatus]